MPQVDTSAISRRCLQGSHWHIRMLDFLTRPGAEIEAGPFGVFYGWNKSSSFPCAKEGCGHICKPRCGACFSIEMQWRKCWRMHRRYAVREEVSATTVSNKLGTKREGVGKDEKVKTAAVGEEDVDDPLLHTGRREGTLGVVEKRQGLYWEEKQHLVPSLCFSEDEEQEGGKEKDQDEGAGILFEDEDEEKERVEGREKRRGGSNEKKTRRARGIGAIGATDEEKKRQDEKQETEGVTRRSGNTEQETREKNKQQYIQVRTQQHPQMVKTQQQQQEQQLRLPHRVEQPQSQSTDDGSSGGKDVKMSCASDNVESSGPALGRRSEVKTQHALLPAHATEMKNAREQFATGAQRRQESLKAAAGGGVFATVVVTKPEEKAIAAEKEGVYLWGCAKKEKHSPSEKGASSSSYEEQSVQSSRGSLAAVAAPIASAEAKTTCEEDKEAWGEKVYAGSCGCLNRLISSKSRNCCCGEDVHTTPRRKWCECTQEEFFQFKCKKSNSCRAHTKSGSRSAVAMEMRLDQTAAAATASNDAGANYCSPGTLYRRASTMTWDEEQEVGEEEETQEVNHSDIPLEKQLLLHVTSLAGGSSIRVPITKNCNLKRGEGLSGDKTVEASTWRTGALMSADEVPAAAIATASATKAAAAAAGEARRTAVAAEREATGESAGEARRDAKNAAERQEETEKSTLDNSGRDDEIVCEEGRTQRGQHRKKDASCGLGKEDATLNSFKQQLRREQGEKNSSNSSSNSAIDTLAAWEPRTAVCGGRRRAGDDVVAAVCAAVAVLRAAVAAEAEMAKYLDKEETFSEKEVLTKKIEAEKEEENSAVSKNARDVSLARDILPSMQDQEKHHHMSRKRLRSGFLSEEAKDQRENEKTSTITPRTGEKQEGTEKSVQLHVLKLCPRKTAASCPSAEISYCATSEKAALKQVSRKTRCRNEGRSEQHIALPVEVAEVLSSTEAVTEEEKGPLMCSTSRRCCAVSPWWPLQDQSPLTQQTKKQQQEEEAEKFCSTAPAALGELNTSCSVHAQQEAGISPTDVIPQRSKKCRCSMPAPICERRREGDLALIQAASLLDADPACCAAFAALAAVVPLASPVYLRPLPPLLPRSVTPAEKPCRSSSCTQWPKSKLPGCCCCGCYDREQNNSDWRSCCDRCNRNCCTGQGTGRVCSTPCLTTSVSSVSSIASIMGNVAKLVHKPSSIQQSIQEVTEPPMKDRRQISTVTLLVDAATRLLLSLSAAATADRGNDSNNSKEVPLPR